MNIIRLENYNNEIFPIICKWYYQWLGQLNGECMEEIVYTFMHSVNTTRLPQTFVALSDNIPVGMYQLAIFDDLNCRPDLYPWLINVYVDEEYRGQHVCQAMMESVRENAKKAKLTELYLYTEHVGLYEKFGWRFMEEVNTFKNGPSVQRIYKLTI